MKEITEHFGIGFLHLVTGFCMIGIFAVFLQNKGLIYDLVVAFMHTIA